MNFPKLIKELVFFLVLIKRYAITFKRPFDIISLIYEIIIHLDEFRKLHLANVRAILEE